MRKTSSNLPLRIGNDKDSSRILKYMKIQRTGDTENCKKTELRKFTAMVRVKADLYSNYALDSEKMPTEQELIYFLKFRNFCLQTSYIQARNAQPQIQNRSDDDWFSDLCTQEMLDRRPDTIKLMDQEDQLLKRDEGRNLTNIFSRNNIEIEDIVPLWMWMREKQKSVEALKYIEHRELYQSLQRAEAVKNVHFPDKTMREALYDKAFLNGLFGNIVETRARIQKILGPDSFI